MFGDEGPKKVGPPNHPAQAFSWAKFKEVNPDEFRTPMKPFGEVQNQQQPFLRPEGPQGNFRRGPFGPWAGPQDRGPGIRGRFDPRLPPRGVGPMGPMGPMNSGPGFPGNRMNFHVGPGERFPGPMENFRGQPDQRTNAVADGIGHYFDRLHSTDPDVVLNQVIPVIIRQAQENLQSGRLVPDQFTNLMKQIMHMKEQAMMLQADKLHRNQPGVGGGWNKPMDKMPAMPGLPPMLPGSKEMPPALAPPKPPPFVNKDLPMASVEELEQIASDPVSTIDIDHRPRDIRFYGEKATVVMGPGDVRELTFNSAGFDTFRFVVIDEQMRLKLPVNVPSYVPFVLNGFEHRIRLGAPTRELWIDGKWYQCYFNEFIHVQIGPNYHKVFLEGRPPNVNIGKVPLRDICRGTVQLIVDADINNPVPIYLDSKPQRIDIAGKPHVLKFVEGLRTLLINGHPFMTHFGGTPMLVHVNQERHYLRLTSLPDDARPDKAKGRGPDNKVSPKHPSQGGPPSPPMLLNENSLDAPETGSFENKAFDRILSLMPSPITPKPEKESRRLTSQYSSSADGVLSESQPKSVQAENEPETGNSTPAKPAAVPQVDVQDLWTQLLGAGLVTGGGRPSIPGLEVQAATEPVVVPKKEETADEKKVAPAAPKPVQKPVEPVEVVEPVILKSHHKSLKK